MQHEYSKTIHNVRFINPFSYLSSHLALAVFLTISFRFLADMPAARALPPMRPSATAAAFLPSSVVISSISPVAILAIRMARASTSVGRLWPFGPVGTLHLLLRDRHEPEVIDLAV